MNLDEKVDKLMKISNHKKRKKEDLYKFSIIDQNILIQIEYICMSKKLSWSENKIKKVFKHYKTYNMFPNDHRSRSRSPIKLIEVEHLNYTIDQTCKDRSISSRKLANFWR